MYDVSGGESMTIINNDDGIYIIIRGLMLSFFKGSWDCHKWIERSPDGFGVWFWRFGIRYIEEVRS